MVMTFVLHPMSHYNSITAPRARFSLSLLEGLTIDFLSHFILSLIDVYKDTMTRDKLIFPSTEKNATTVATVPSGTVAKKEGDSRNYCFSYSVTQ